MCNPVQDVSNAVSDLGNSVADVWHDVSAPVVDSQLGRSALTAAAAYFGGPLGAAGVNAGLQANDMSNGNGQNTLGNFIRGVTGYYMAPSGLETAATDPSAFQIASSGEDMFGNILGDGTQQAINSAGSFSLPDIAANQTFSNLGTGLSGADMPIDPTAMVTQGGMNPIATVGQGAPLSYTPMPSGLESPGFLSEFTSGVGNITSGIKDANSWLKENVGMGLAPVGAGLYDMYRKNQAADMLGKQAEMAMRQASGIQSNLSAIQNMYAPGSPEYEMLAQEIARKDAKAGRNSQYGQRAVDLAARINALKNQQYAPGLQALTTMNTNANNLNAGAAALRSGSLNTLGSNWTLANLPK